MPINAPIGGSFPPAVEPLALRPVDQRMLRKKPPSSLELIGIPLSLEPMEARAATSLPDDPGWQFEPKWDGFRCLAFRSADAVEIRAKSGKSLSRFFPEVVANLRSLAPSTFVLDGELVLPVDGTLSFDALQMRLHPAASRIERLSRETPASLILFDCLLSTSGKALLALPFEERREVLETLFAEAGQREGLSLTPFTRDVRDAERWLADRHVQVDGVMAKRLDLPYLPGERAMLKVKRLRTADCVVGGFRYETGGRRVGSLLLGLYDGRGLLHHVGFTSGIPDREKPRLTQRLEELIAPPGFTGNAPGGPSRWSTARSAEWQPLRPELVVEVRYDHVTDNRFRHGTKLVRWRPDKAPAQCTFEQLPQAGAQLAVT
jgi:ATP-dependent DNA ligase